MFQMSMFGFSALQLSHAKFQDSRFRTNPDLIGVEKLAVVAPDKALLESPYKPLPRLPSAGQALIDAGLSERS